MTVHSTRTRTCSCEKGVTICWDAAQLWRAYRAAADIEETLFAHTLTKDGANDPIAHDRHRLAGEVTGAARRTYERHVDEAGERVPEPQSLRVVE